MTLLPWLQSASANTRGGGAFVQGMPVTEVCDGDVATRCAGMESDVGLVRTCLTGLIPKAADTITVGLPLGCGVTLLCVHVSLPDKIAGWKRFVGTDNDCLWE